MNLKLAPPHIWSSSEYKILATLRKQGLTYAQCAEYLDRPEYIVQIKCRELGLDKICVRFPINEEKRALLVKKWNAGWDWSDLARYFKLSHKQVFQTYFNTPEFVRGYYND